MRGYVKRALACALAASSPAIAKTAPPPPEPAEHPNWADTAATGLAILKAQLVDPSSAEITWTSGFQWGYRKLGFNRRAHGWIACGSLNAKNQLGGYVGAQGFLIFRQPGGAVEARMTNVTFSTCDDGPFAPVNPELAGMGAPVVHAGGVVGVADELKKLAELRQAGIISNEEFERQKAKLLAR